MRIVTPAFKEAIKKPVRTMRVSLVLTMKEDGDSVRYAINENAIVSGSLSITEKLTSGKFCYGSVEPKEMAVKIDASKVYGLDPVNINFTNACVDVNFYITAADGQEAHCFLGRYYVDSTKSGRKLNILDIRGADAVMQLAAPAVAMTNVTPYQIALRACELANRRLYNDENDFREFPNGTLTVSFSTGQIQTARDMLMWVADLTGTCVRMSNETNQRVKFVQIPTKYTKAGTPKNFNLDAFIEDHGVTIPADVRFSTDFTDTSVRITTLLMNYKGSQLSAHTDWTFADNTLEGTMELPTNPLIENKDLSVVKNVLNALQDYTDDLRFCPFKCKFNGNPVIETGDFVYLESGGAVDDKKYRHYGVVTYSKWVYHGDCEIRCALDVTAERPETTSAVAAISANHDITPLAVGASYAVNSKSQIEKRLDALSGNKDRIASAGGEQFVIVDNFPAESEPQNSASISVNSGAFNMRTSTSFVNIYPGSTYIRSGSTQIMISNYGISYQLGNMISISIEHETDQYGNQNGGIIRFGNQSIAIRNGHLYINGTEKL